MGYGFSLIQTELHVEKIAISKRNGIEQQQTSEVSIRCSNFEFHYSKESSHRINIPNKQNACKRIFWIDHGYVEC